MDDYIEREATVTLLQSLGSRDYRREKGTIQEAIKMVSSPEYTPSADVEPVRHGRWIQKKTHMWFLDENGEPDVWRFECGFHNGPECQVCHATPCVHCNPDFMDDECTKGHYICSKCGERSVDNKNNFCPNCGSKMDKEDEK